MILDLSNTDLFNIQTTILNLIDVSKIKIFDISNCKLTKLPSEIESLTNLLILNCSNNQIEIIELNNEKLVILNAYDNKLTTFPVIPSSVICLQISKNNIKNIQYKKVEVQRLVVFLYYDNPFDNISKNKNLIILESKRQKYLIDLYYSDDDICYFALEMRSILKNYENKKIRISELKCLEESIYEDYFLYEFVEKYCK